MITIDYCPPSGGVIENPTPEVLAHVIMNPREDYWLAGSADAGLHLGGVGKGGPFMVLMYRKQFGFLVHFDSGSSDLPVVLCERPDDAEVVSIEYCGNDLRVPKSHFVSPPAALEAAVRFVATGKCTDAGRWIAFSPEEP